MKRSTKRTVLTTVLGAASCLGAALGGSGCRPDFPPYNRVTELRILGFQSDPPAPFTNDPPATWSALIYTPPGVPAPSYAWSWCPFPRDSSEGFECQFTQEQLNQMFPDQVGKIPPLDLGNGETASLRNTVDGELLRAFCTGNGARPVIASCEHGFPFQVMLKVNTPAVDSRPAEEVIGVVTGHWRFDAAMPENTNPSIDDLTATLPNSVPTTIADPLADPSMALIFPRDVATRIDAVVPETSAEMYDGFDDDDEPKRVRERLFMTWFVETGGTDDSRTSFIATLTDPAEDMRRFEALKKNTWGPALKKDYAPDTARLFVVIHDNRGGVSWKTGTVNLEPTP